MAPIPYGNDHTINEVMLHRARLLLGLVTAFSGSTTTVFSRPLSLASTTCRSFGHCCGRNGEFCSAMWTAECVPA